MAHRTPKLCTCRIWTSRVNLIETVLWAIYGTNVLFGIYKSVIFWYRTLYTSVWNVHIVCLITYHFFVLPKNKTIKQYNKFRARSAKYDTNHLNRYRAWCHIWHSVRFGYYLLTIIATKIYILYYFFFRIYSKSPTVQYFFFLVWWTAIKKKSLYQNINTREIWPCRV